jgi:hypothetical protein
MARSAGEVLYLVLRPRKPPLFKKCYHLLNCFSSRQSTPAPDTPFNPHIRTRYVLSCLKNDRIRTTVPFHTINETTNEAVIHAAVKRMSKLLNAFDEVFDKAERVSWKWSFVRFPESSFRTVDWHHRQGKHELLLLREEDYAQERTWIGIRIASAGIG